MKKKRKWEEAVCQNSIFIYIAAVIKTVGYWQREMHREQMNITENLEIDPHKYTKLIFDTGAKTQGKKDSIFLGGECKSLYSFLLDLEKISWISKDNSKKDKDNISQSGRFRHL